MYIYYLFARFSYGNFSLPVTHRKSSSFLLSSRYLKRVTTSSFRDDNGSSIATFSRSVKNGEKIEKKNGGERKKKKKKKTWWRRDALSGRSPELLSVEARDK